MATRREIKKDALARVAAEKDAARARKAELKAMAPEERRAAKAADRTAARAAKKQAKADRKAARSSMTRAERREAKRRERVYRKVKHRPRRLIGWSVVVVVVALVVVLAAPVVSDIRRLLSIDIDTTTAEGVAAREYGTQLAEEISDEGIVLLKNDDGVLPLSDRTVNVFSFASFALRFGGAGSGAADQSTAVGLYEALETQGVTYNPELHAVMVEAGAGADAGSSTGLGQIVDLLLGGGTVSEPEPDYLTADVLAQAQAFSGTAMIVLGNDGRESSDFEIEELRITPAQRQLLDTVTAHFDEVIVVVNSGNTMELGFLDEYPQLKAAVWIGTPGPKGAVSLAKVLTGEVNPSGRLTATYARDVSSAPAVENYGDFRYENVSRGLLEYEEGIYVGYRYYETRYAGDEASYAQAVQFPFGFGLSYTTFDWSAAEPVVTDDEVTVEVTVTNTGAVPGKDVVQVYHSAPYTPGGIEKSAIELAGYAKTAELQPGQSETVTVTFAVRDMASWDMAGGAYVLDAGIYEISARTDVHTSIATFEAEVTESRVYVTDAATGVPLENRFGFAGEGLTTLSRDDWEGTWPDSSDIGLTASDALLERMNPEFEPVEGEAPIYGADNGLLLEDLRGLDYDDPQWAVFLDQLTKDEQVRIFAEGAYRTAAVERLGIPAAVLLDGPAGLNFFFGDVTAASFPTEVVIASTWNDDLARAMGEAIGAEANAYGVQGWYAPGQNLHRTALGGRNFEYFSEDPLLSGRMSAAMVAGAQSRDLLTFMKHFALNEQEVNARAPGVNVFASEQALRELYLRPFEITVKEAGANGAMTSFINIGGVWSGGNEALLQDVLRGEWGFQGVVSTDAVLGGFMDPALAVRHGNDLMLAPLSSSVVRAVNAELRDDPVGVGQGLRDRVHAVLFALTQTDLFE